MPRQAVIVEALRTPIARRKQEFAEVRADDLAAHVLRGVVEKSGIDVREVDDIYMGCVTAVGEQGVNVARLAALAAGFPVEITGTTMNRLCGSSQQAFDTACMAVMAGEQDLVIAAGVENMTRVAMGSDAGSFNEKLLDRFDLVQQGVSAELVADRWGIGRRELDEFSLRSHQRAIEAAKKGYFKKEILPTPYPNGNGGALLDRDTGPRADSTLEKIAQLEPIFRKPNGVIHAGNSSQISDGAGALLITTPEKAKALGLKPRARYVTSAVAGVDPVIMLTGPIPSTKKALARAQLTIKDIDVVEINEAFSSVAVACGRDLGFDWAKTNPNGGAVAMGHPLGATGAILLVKALHHLERTGGRYGLTTMCIGFGQGITTIIERL